MGKRGILRSEESAHGVMKLAAESGDGVWKIYADITRRQIEEV